jgi:large subunit ribosomal protein L4
VVEAQHADPLSLIHFQKVLILKSAVAQIEEMLK